MAANTKRKAKHQPKEAQIRWPSEILGRFSVVVQQGVSPSDTVIRAQCKHCQTPEELPASEGLRADSITNEGQWWFRKIYREHRRCVGRPTRMVQQQIILEDL